MTASLLALELLTYLKIEHGMDEYEYFVKRLTDYRTEIEKEFKTSDKRTNRPDESIDPGISIERVCAIQRSVPTVIASTTERIFDNPEEIKEG